MTNSWTDIKNADVVWIMGGNAAEAHPCGFKWVTEAKATRGAQLMVVDPRFTRSAAVSDHYAPLRPGTDIAFLSGVINYLLENDAIHRDYVRHYTNASYIVKEEYGFEDGLFTGYNEERRSYDRSSWEYEMNDDGTPRRDLSLRNPRCVFQLMRQHFAPYTPEMVERVSGTPQDRFLKVCEMAASTGNGERAMTIMYALGWTQHSHGSQNIRSAAMIQLLLGNIGVPGGGINALRGHSNVQGLTDMGTLSGSIPGYLAMPTDAESSLEAHLSRRAASFRPLRENQLSFWQNYPKFYVSFLKTFYGDRATPENDFGYDMFPKMDASYDTLNQFERMHQGLTNIFVCQGFNPLMSVSHKDKLTRALSNLKLLVSIDPLETETVRFWENHGDANDVDPAQIQTEVFMLPAATFAEDDGTFTNSSRNIIWKWKAADLPGEARRDGDIVAELFLRLRKLYEEEGGTGAEQFLSVDWSYSDPAHPDNDEILREINGRALVDLTNAEGVVTRAAGEQLAAFGEMRADGSTDGACWIYTGCYGPNGNNTARRNNEDPSGLGVYGQWGFAWPANRRVLYNRASADPQGRPWSEAKAYMQWDGERWSGPDIPDFPPTSNPSAGMSPFIMNPEGVSRLWVRQGMTDGPFPVHYEPFESPVANPLFPQVKGNPAARVFAGDMEVFGDASEFPIVATTYRLVEHFHFWTKNVHMNAVVQPEFFVEMSEQLAAEKGISTGNWVRVTSNRASVVGKAVVTKRLKPLQIDGRTVHTVGMPIHYGFVGAARKSVPVNSLTPFVGDANSQTPEFKAFLVDVEPAAGPATA